MGWDAGAGVLGVWAGLLGAVYLTPVGSLLVHRWMAFNGCIGRACALSGNRFRGAFVCCILMSCWTGGLSGMYGCRTVVPGSRSSLLKGSSRLLEPGNRPEVRG